MLKTWKLVAKELIEGDSRGALLVDARGTVVLVNSAFAQLANTSREQIVGQAWTAMIRNSRADPAPTVKELIAQPIPFLTSTVQTRSGRQMVISWASTPIGEGPGAGAIVRVLRAIDRTRVSRR